MVRIGSDRFYFISKLFLTPLITIATTLIRIKNNPNIKYWDYFKLVLIGLCLIAYLGENTINAANTRLSLHLLFIFIISYLFCVLLPKFESKNVSIFKMKLRKKSNHFFVFKCKKVITFLLINTMLLSCLVLTYHRYLGQKEVSSIRKLVREKQWKIVKEQVSTAYNNNYYTLTNRTYPLQSYLALAYQKTKEPHLSEYCYQKALNEHPYHYPTFLGLGELYFQEKKYKKARQYYLKVIDIFDQHRKANLRLAQTDLKLGRYDKAYYWTKKIRGYPARKKAIIRAIKKAKNTKATK